MKAEMHRQILRGRRPVRADHRLRTDEKRVRTQSAILIKSTSAYLGLSITVFSVRMCFSSVRKTRLARGARNGCLATLADETGYFELQRQILRGRRPVRADHRLRTDEKHIRAQSAILVKTPGASLGLSITVFLVRMRFSSVPKTGLARGARNGCLATLADETGYFELHRQTLRGRRPVRADRRLCADEKHIRAQSAILYKSNVKRDPNAKCGRYGATHD